MRKFIIMSRRSRKASGIIKSESEDLRISETKGVTPSLRTGEDEMKWQISPLSTFCSIQALNGLDKVCQHRGGQSTLLSPLIQRLTLSGDTLRDVPRNNV